MTTGGQDEAVEAALLTHTASCMRSEAGAWKVAIANGSEVHATARVAEGWVLFESALTGAAGRDPWELLRWNAKVNLTAITDPAEVVEKHLLDSLAIAPEVAGVRGLLDIGTGAGFGPPLHQMTVLDQLMQRLDAVNEGLRRRRTTGQRPTGRA